MYLWIVKKRDDILADLHAMQQKEKEEREKKLRFARALKKIDYNITKKSNPFERQNVDEDVEFQKAIQRAEKLEKTRIDDNAIVNKILQPTLTNDSLNENKVTIDLEKNDKMEMDMNDDNIKKENINNDNNNDEGLVFTTAMQFSNGLRDAVDEMMNDEIKKRNENQYLQRKYFNNNHGIDNNNNANDIIAQSGHDGATLVNIDNNIDGNGMLPNEDTGGWVEENPSQNKDDKDNLYKSFIQFEHSEEVNLHDNQSNNNKNYVSAEDIILEREPLVGHSLTECLSHVKRRGFNLDEEFDEVAGGRTDQFRPIDIEKKERKY